MRSLWLQPPPIMNKPQSQYSEREEEMEYICWISHKTKSTEVDPEVKDFPCRHLHDSYFYNFLPCGQVRCAQRQKRWSRWPGWEEHRIEVHSVKMTRSLNICTHVHTQIWWRILLWQYIEHLEVGTNRLQNSNGWKSHVQESETCMHWETTDSI